MSADILITFNAGSSSVKIGLFTVGENGPTLTARAVIDLRKAPLGFRITEGPQTFEVDLEAHASEDLTDVMAETFGWLARHFDMTATRAIGHRVVHGGDRFDGPVLLDEAAIAEIDALTRLAPLHQPRALRLIRAVRALRPDLAQVASFDTAFHRDHADVVRRFAIPRDLHDRGIRRYGFDGLSYKFIAREMARRAPEVAKGRWSWPISAAAPACAAWRTALAATAAWGSPRSTAFPWRRAAAPSIRASCSISSATRDAT